MTKLAYLANKSGGAYCQCSTLVLYNWLEKQTKTVVNIVDTINGDEFPGLYSLLLPERCWCDDNIRVVIDTEWRSKCEAVVINTDTSEVIRLTKDDEIGNWHVLDVVDDYVLAQCSPPNQPHFLMVGELPEANKEQEIKWNRLGEDATLEDITWKILKHNRSPDGDVTKEFESVLISPKTDSSKKPPLVVYPHGGPHSVFSSEYSLYAAALCKCGFAVLFVNYGGSTGFGQASIEALPGNIGTADVSDVQFAAECVVNSAFKLVHKRRVFLAGGSHGGFLTAHLIGQYPDFYRAAVLRNPVVNIASMMHTTDIPDWCCVEAGLGFDFKTICDPAGYQALWKHSPIRYADQMKTPSIIMLGANDLRVPPSQGKELYKALHSRGVTVRLLIYPDNSHPLNKVDTEADAFMNIVKWFWDHLHKEVPEETI
ncbi:acylamino-acid-releasing enzyme-like [Lingula anatina]|uniref:acylaminoacyl-peptidase n=1 Tax=Lingula anatina TaxID=7574 RepID=A0A1S3JUB2_LINAN|nr:acylamino-acid-releasing enzyme-like [Lingula anatina]|eukprot:XP_013413674.1 acylamino-acid-releasing enzyme-like [Lingula anatina]